MLIPNKRVGNHVSIISLFSVLSQLDWTPYTLRSHLLKLGEREGGYHPKNQDSRGKKQALSLKTRWKDNRDGEFSFLL